MTDTPQSTAQGNPLPQKELPLDPLRRVFVPIEKRALDGHWRFQTIDKTRYQRDAGTGVIRRCQPKPLTKHQRRRTRAND